MTVGLLLFIFTFGVYANLYMFRVFSWRIILSGTLVSWSGYAFGAITALILKQPYKKILAIAIETGVQNTGISIVLLRLSLPQPEADLSSVLPVSGSIMVFIPLFCCWCKKTVRERCERQSEEAQARSRQQLVPVATASKKHHVYEPNRAPSGYGTDATNGTTGGGDNAGTYAGIAESRSIASNVSANGN